MMKSSKYSIKNTIIIIYGFNYWTGWKNSIHPITSFTSSNMTMKKKQDILNCSIEIVHDGNNKVTINLNLWI